MQRQDTGAQAGGQAVQASGCAHTARGALVLCDVAVAAVVMVLKQ